MRSMKHFPLALALAAATIGMAVTAPAYADPSDPGPLNPVPFRKLLPKDDPAPAPGNDGGAAIPANSGSGRRIVYCNHCQRVWLIEGDGRLVSTYLVSGKRFIPSPGTYHVFSKSPVSTSGSTLLLYHMVRFAHGTNLAIGFHRIPVVRSTGQQIESDSQLGQPLSHGCVRQSAAQAAFLYSWAPIGTTVVVLA